MVNTCITRLWQNWSRLFLDFLKPSKINWNPEVSLFEISRKKREFRYNFRSVREIWRPKVYITFILQGKKRPNRVVLAINRAIFRQDRKLKWIQAWSLLVLIATFAFRTVPGSKVTLPGLATAYHVELLKSTICRTSTEIRQKWRQRVVHSAEKEGQRGVLGDLSKISPVPLHASIKIPEKLTNGGRRRTACFREIVGIHW